MSKLDYTKVQEYLKDLVPPRSKKMQELEAYAQETDFPIIGPVCGYLCYQIARMIGARRVFELGSGFGYSTAWFARAVKENGGGIVYHVVWDEGLSRQARKHLDELGFNDIVQYHVGEAVSRLKQEPEPFDLIFSDINKEGYPASLPVITDKLRVGGVLIADNLLWSGRIFDESDRSPATSSVREFSRLIFNDEKWICSVVPSRDGLLIAYKK
jgi:caffeoyl-CoA O-methyltransferase